MTTSANAYPALHNAMWPGLVGKGPDSEPPTDIDSSDDDLARLAENIASKGLCVGSLVAPVWPPTGGGSAMGNEVERSSFLTQVKKACSIGRKLRDLKIRSYGIVR